MGIVVIVIVVTVAILVIINRASARSREADEVEVWFADALVKRPPQPLVEDKVTTARRILFGDDDLWYYLGRDLAATNRETCFKQVMDVARYLNVFSEYANAAIIYGAFDVDGVYMFNVWLEFRYRGETIWTLSLNRGKPEIARFFDFRVNNGDLVYRHPIQFIEAKDPNLRYPV